MAVYSPQTLSRLLFYSVPCVSVSLCLLRPCRRDPVEFTLNPPSQPNPVQSSLVQSLESDLFVPPIAMARSVDCCRLLSVQRRAVRDKHNTNNLFIFRLAFEQPLGAIPRRSPSQGIPHPFFTLLCCFVFPLLFLSLLLLSSSSAPSPIPHTHTALCTLCSLPLLAIPLISTFAPDRHALP